jgi:hypothetical protein
MSLSASQVRRYVEEESEESDIEDDFDHSEGEFDAGPLDIESSEDEHDDNEESSDSSDDNIPLVHLRRGEYFFYLFISSNVDVSIEYLYYIRCILLFCRRVLQN